MKHFKGSPRKIEHERIAIEIETGRLFTRNTIPQNADLRLVELDGDERFDFMRKAINRARKKEQSEMMAVREFKKKCISTEPIKYPTPKEYELFSALVGSTKKQAEIWHKQLNTRLIF